MLKIPKMLRRDGRTEAECDRGGARSGCVTIGGETFAVGEHRRGEVCGERRAVVRVAPAGVRAEPVGGAECVMCEVGGDSVLLGCVEGGEARRIELTASGAAAAFGDEAIEIRADESVVVLGGEVIELRVGECVVRVGRNEILLDCGGAGLSISGGGVKVFPEQ